MLSRNRKLAIAWMLAALLGLSPLTQAEPTVAWEHNQSGFKFVKIPLPVKGDAAAQASFSVVSGRIDPNSGGLEALHDDKLAAEEDQPAASFFFRAGEDGGRILIDLGSTTEITEVNSYSWHANTRAPQVYNLYASRADSPNFVREPQKAVDPLTCGWELVAKVNAQSKEIGGSYGVSIKDQKSALGQYRYLLFDVKATEHDDPFGNTFFSEVDVISATGPAPVAITNTSSIQILKRIENDRLVLTLDLTAAPELSDWAEKELVPALQEWHPKLGQLLPSSGYEPPTNITIRFRDGMGGTPAAASGSRIDCNAQWFKNNLKGEAKGSVVHEMVHVVQQYGRARRNPNRTQTPGWVVEGIADYIRWFIYEPEKKGAEITTRNLSRARYDASYRVTANFLNWVSQQYDKEIVSKLNSAAREGRYSEELWKTATGKTVQELGAEWKKQHEERLAKTPAS